MIEISNKHLRELYVEINDTNLITFISSNCFSLLGYSEKELLLTDIRNYVNFPTDISNNKNFETTILLKNGLQIDIDMLVCPIINSIGVVIGKRLSIIQKHAFFKVNTTEDLLHGLLSNSRDIIYRFDVFPEFKFVYISSSVEDILGYTIDQYAKNPCFPLEITHPDDRDYILDKLSGKIDFSVPRPVRYKHKNGNYIYLEDYNIPLYDDLGIFIGFQGISRDVTDRKKLEDNLLELSYYDGLTNLFNKMYFEKQVDYLNTKENTSIGVIFGDLDNLKWTNDKLGHEWGDRLIVKAANIFKNFSKDNTLISRVGGDEFVILLKNSSIDETRELYSTLTNSIKTQNKFNKKYPIKISIGYAFSENSIGTIRKTIHLADKNMYKNKPKKLFACFL